MYLHLKRLKDRILPPELVAQLRYDARLESLAEGVAEAFDRATGRLLRRAADAVEERQGGSTLYYLSHYPVESLAGVEIREGLDGTPRDVAVARLSKSTGIVRLISPAGTNLDTLTIRYAGGYWVDLSEAGDETPPSGSAAMPGDLIDAWCLQIDHEARIRKIFGGAKGEDVAKDLPEAYDLLPRVQRVLKGYLKVV